MPTPVPEKQIKLIGLLLLCAVFCAESKQLYLSLDGNDSPACGEMPGTACKSLHQAISNGAGEISFVSGYYHWSEVVNITAPSLSLFGNGPEEVFIDCQSNAGWTLNVTTLNISNMMFTNCVSPYSGGALSIAGVDVTLSNLLFFSNTVTADDGNGGAVLLISSGNSAIESCSFVSNDVESYFGGGGGLCISSTGSANVSVNTCNFTANTASFGYGGGIVVYNNGDATVYIDDCTFTANTAGDGGDGGGGGGISITDSGSSTTYINNCSFTGNIATSGNGGGVFVADGNYLSFNGDVAVHISDCTFTANIATGEGGGSGIFVESTSEYTFSIGDFTVYINKCTFTANDIGGGVLINTGMTGDVTVYISECSFVNNTSTYDYSGGGIYIFNRNIISGNVTVYISDCSFTSNTVNSCGGSSGGGVYIFNSNRFQGYATVYVSDCSFTDNTANSGCGGGGGGGGISLYNSNTVGGDASVYISDCTFTNNTANYVDGYAAGGIYVINTNAGSGDASVYINNCKVAANTAGGISVSNSNSGTGDVSVDISGSTFTSNTGLTGAGISVDNSNTAYGVVTAYISNCNLTANDANGISVSNSNSGAGDASVHISDTTFTANTANDTNGGAINVINTNTGNTVIGYNAACNVYITNCTFTGNTAHYGGGGIYAVNSNIASGDAMVYMSDCKFAANTANYGSGGGVVVFSSNTGNGAAKCNAEISNCTFTANTANYGSGGAISVVNSNTGNTVTAPVDNTCNVYVSNCTFTANTANDNGGGLQAVTSNAGNGEAEVSVSGSSFRDNSAGHDGGAICVNLEQALLNVSSSTFTSCSAQNAGALYAIGIGTVTVSSCNYNRNIATSLGGAILVSGAVMLSLQKCSLVNNMAIAGGGLFIEDSYVSLTNVDTYGNTASTYGGDLIAVLAGSLMIESVNFTHGVASVAGGSMALFFTPSASVLQSVISDASAGSGGAMLVDPSSSVQVTDCVFTNNTARSNGGAIEVEGALFMNTSTFIGNHAVDGASLYLPAVTSVTTSILHCLNCSFEQNRAYAGGACIFWQGAGAEPFCENCTFAVSNQAAYGAWKATPALRLSVAAPTGVVTDSTASLSAILQDYYNQSVVITPTPVLAAVGVQADVTSSASMPNGSTVATVAVYGLNKPLSLTFQAWTLTSDPVVVQIGECAQGFGYKMNRCVLCNAGTYTANTLVPCQACNATLICNGGADVTIDSNYWPNINASTGVVEGLLCPFDFCDTTSSTGNIFDTSTVCNPELNRNGSSTLCGECLSGFTEWSHECVPCNGIHGGAIVVQLLQLTGIVLLQRILSQSPSGATGFVMLVFVYQFADLALYPKPLLQRMLNTFGLQLPAGSLGCPFSTSAYGELAVQLVTPLVCLALLALMYTANVGLGKLFSYCSRHALVTGFFVATGDRDAYIRTLVVLSLNLYETILEAAFNFLVCVQGMYNDVNVVYQYPSVSCNDPYYAKVRIVLIAVVALFVLGPVVIFAWLTRQRQMNNNSLKHLEQRYGRLFACFKPGFYFWECIALLRRAVLLAVFVPIAGKSLAAAKAALLACVLVFAAVQVALRPYQQRRDNQFEVISLFTLSGLIGLFSNNDLNYTVQSYLGGTLLISVGLVLITPSVVAAARNARDFARRRRSKSTTSISENQGQLLTPLV